jgi:hypothetical protein
MKVGNYKRVSFVKSKKMRRFLFLSQVDELIATSKMRARLSMSTLKSLLRENGRYSSNKMRLLIK